MPNPYQQSALPKLTLTQKIVGALGLVGFGLIAFFTAGIVLTILAAFLIIGGLSFSARWLWCKVTGKPFLPNVDIQFGQFEQFRRKQRADDEHETLEGEFHRVDESSKNIK